MMNDEDSHQLPADTPHIDEGPPSVSIVVIGDEVLHGHVRDENSWFLIDQLREHAVLVDHVQVIGDDVSAIASVLQEELRRSRPRLILTCGGIGATPDDLTYEAIGRSLDKPLVANPYLGDLIKSLIAQLETDGYDVTAEDRSWLETMGRLPDGMEILGDDGWAVASYIEVAGGLLASEGATIAALPGVPPYLRRIFSEVVEPHLLPRSRGDEAVFAEVQHDLPEALVARFVVELRRNFSPIQVGSYAHGQPCLRLTGPQHLVRMAEKQLRVLLDSVTRPESSTRPAH